MILPQPIAVEHVLFVEFCAFRSVKLEREVVSVLPLIFELEVASYISSSSLSMGNRSTSSNGNQQDGMNVSQQDTDEVQQIEMNANQQDMNEIQQIEMNVNEQLDANGNQRDGMNMLMFVLLIRISIRI